jgi:ABC-2 type transport system permease protein
MIAAFLFYFYATLKNRILARLRRLRQPKYLIPALAGGLYVYFAFIHQSFIRVRSRGQPDIRLDFSAAGSMETAFAFGLLIFVLLPWILPARGGGITFTAAEVQFLFPAPLRRRTLLHFRIAKGQLGIIFGVLISTLVFGQGRSLLRTPYLASGLWIVYSFLALYRMGVAMAQASLSEHGWSAVKRQLWTLAGLAGIIVCILVWIRWFIPVPPVLRDSAPEDLLEWFSRLLQAGPLYYLLLPFRALLRPALSRDGTSFLLSLAPALMLLALSYLWVIRSDASFEEASLERSEKAAQRIEARKRGLLPAEALRSGRARRPPFRLASEGFPFVAFFWKNLISSGRVRVSRLLALALAITGATVWVASGGSSSSSIVPAMIGGAAAGIALFVAIMGPVVIRDDLRNDLLHLDLIKTYPVPGWSVVLGEVMAPAAVLACTEWFLLFLAVCFLPGLGNHALPPYQRVVFGMCAAVLLPCFSLLGVLIQNAAALLMPGWIHLGKEHQQGIEAMGQRLIMAGATGLVLLFAVIPAAILFSMVFLSAYWLIGLAVAPIASMVAAIGLLIEAAVAIVWLGRLFDSFDASLEIETTGI